MKKMRKLILILLGLIYFCSCSQIVKVNETVNIEKLNLLSESANEDLSSVYIFWRDPLVERINKGQGIAKIFSCYINNEKLVVLKGNSFSRIDLVSGVYEIKCLITHDQLERKRQWTEGEFSRYTFSVLGNEKYIVELYPAQPIIDFKKFYDFKDKNKILNSYNFIAPNKEVLLKLDQYKDIALKD